jgi:FkbM family methyltransferase
MSDFYSQNGEDFILDEIFKDKNNGFFVEVGCIDGRRFSNTLRFEEKGWKGLCVEAHEGYIELLKMNRPGSIVCHSAAADVDEEDVTFYANARGSLSTLDSSQEEKFRREFKDYFSGFEEQKVVKRRLDTLFNEFNIKEIDILSLDIEGYEVEALRGIDFNIYKPKVMVIEADSPKHKKHIDEILLPAGYFVIGALLSNVFYTTDKALVAKFRGKHFKGVTLLHTEHPLDKDGDNSVTVDIQLKNQSVINMLAMKLSGFLR